MRRAAPSPTLPAKGEGAGRCIVTIERPTHPDGNAAPRHRFRLDATTLYGKFPRKKMASARRASRRTGGLGRPVRRRGVFRNRRRFPAPRPAQATHHPRLHGRLSIVLGIGFVAAIRPNPTEATVAREKQGVVRGEWLAGGESPPFLRSKFDSVASRG